MPQPLRLARPSHHERQIEVVLAEDHATMRRSLRMVLDAEPEVRVVAEASDLAGALEQVLSHRPDVLVLDMRMPGGTGIELIEHMRQRQPQTEIVVLTMLESPAFARTARAVGARASSSRTRRTRNSAKRCAEPPASSTTRAPEWEIRVNAQGMRSSPVPAAINAGSRSACTSPLCSSWAAKLGTHRRPLILSLGRRPRSDTTAGATQV